MAGGLVPFVEKSKEMSRRAASASAPGEGELMQPSGGATAQNDLPRLRERVENLSRLMEVTSLISSTLDLEVVMKRVMTLAIEVMYAETASIMLWNEEAQCLEFEISIGGARVDALKTVRVPKGQGIAGTVMETGEPMLIEDVTKDSRFFAKADEATGFVTKSILAAPLAVRGRIIGVSEVLNHMEGRPFTEQDLELFASFCRQVAVAIENAQLHKSELKRVLFDQQMTMAASIQKSFLPVTLPEDERGRFEVDAYSKSAQEVGGDFYNVIALPDGRLGFCLGDVSGKGVPAALYMARLVSEFRILCADGASVGEVTRALNEDLSSNSMRGMFVTFQYGILDWDAGELSIANAGHLPSLCAGGDGSARFVGAASGPPLGMLPKSQYQEQRISLEPGDRLLLYSDGIVEARNSAGEDFGEEKLQYLVATEKGGAKSLLAAVLQRIQEFSEETTQADDMTLVTVSWKGQMR